MNKGKSQRNLARIKKSVGPTPERRRHNGGVIRETVAVGDGRTYVNRYRAAWECPLDAYFGRNVIGKAEYLAGLCFHRAYYGAVICRNNLLPTSETQAARKPTMSEKLLNKAHEILPQQELVPVIDVCGHGLHIWNPAALEKLRKGLGRLAIEWHTNAIEVCERKKD